jgi:small-conductance mechanosensitive channel
MPLLLAAAASACQSNPLKWVCDEIQARTGSGSVLGLLVQDVLDGILVFLLVLIAGWVLRRVAVSAMERRADEQVRTLTRNVMTVLTWVFAVVGGLVAGGFDPVWVFTFGGIFSLAVGLALQDLLRNVLAGILILMEKPFRIGDQVTIADQEGIVETIALRTTQLRTGDGRLAVLPNLTVFQSVILNSTAFDQRRYSLNLKVEPPTEPARLVETARAAVTSIATISKQPAPTVQLQIDAEGRRLVVVSYWLDYRAHDPDAVSADLLTRIWGASGGAVASQAESEPETPAH